MYLARLEDALERAADLVTRDKAYIGVFERIDAEAIRTASKTSSDKVAHARALIGLNGKGPSHGKRK